MRLKIMPQPQTMEGRDDLWGWRSDDTPVTFGNFEVAWRGDWSRLMAEHCPIDGVTKAVRVDEVWYWELME